MNTHAQKKASTGNSFSEQYNHPKWQKKRLEILKRDEFKCCRCGDSEHQLQIHHLYYDKGSKVWEYPDRALVTLCDECHNDLHNEMGFSKLVLRHFYRSFAMNDGVQIDKLNSFLGSFVHVSPDEAVFVMSVAEDIISKLSNAESNGYYRALDNLTEAE